MLKPRNLTSGELPIAARPGIGKENRFYISVAQPIEVGTFEILGANSGVWNANPDAGAYVTNKFVVAEIENNYNGAANIVFTWGTAAATFKAPSHVVLQDNFFEAGFAKEVENGSNTAYAKPGTDPTVVCNADAKGTKITVFALPDTTFGTSGNYKLVGCKTQINYSDPSADSVAIQCGGDRAAFIKPGEVPDKTFSVSAKIPTEGDVVTRIPGQRVIGLVTTIKEDKVEVMRTYFFGLFLKATRTLGESVEPDMINLAGRYEDMAMIVADS